MFPSVPLKSNGIPSVAEKMNLRTGHLSTFLELWKYVDLASLQIFRQPRARPPPAQTLVS